MSTLTDRIAAVHTLSAATSVRGVCLYCDACRQSVGELTVAGTRERLVVRHIAEVTEAAVRAQTPTLPTREQIARAIHEDDHERGRNAHEWGEYPETDGWYLDNADAVLALLRGVGVATVG